ncbi:MAG: hypothetical protein EP308_00250 [Burkholderiales bacterium]|nr:MAG: hypothetical protein EP308_00250 [Burkholderiales bacterium]
MKILSHRGYWKSVEEKNTPAAFERSFSLGFGTETDLRDLAGQLVVSHDPPTSTALIAHDLFAIHRRHDPGLTLALNIKADGMQRLLQAELEGLEGMDAFVFDMSVPDTLHWLATGIPVFTRHSDVEPAPALYDKASGVWLDGFGSDWWDAGVIARHLDAGKRVCIVSPELHRRDHRPVWERLASADLPDGDRLMICTDLPEQAKELLSHDH